jgi:hypothetical protein
MIRFSRSTYFIAVILIVAACAKHETVNPILGSWLYTKVSQVSSNPDENYDVPCTDGCVTVTFKSDFTYSYDNGIHGKYQLYRDQIVLDASAPATFAIKGSTLTFVWQTTLKKGWSWSTFTETLVRR